MRTALRTLVLVTTLGLIGAAVPAQAADTTPRGVTVSSTGSVKVAPDAATVNYTISILAATSGIALDTTNSLQKQARLVALSNDVKASDIATTSISITPEYQYITDRAPTLMGYRSTQSTSVTVYSLTKAAAIVDGLAGLSSDIQVNSIALFVSHPSKYEEKARTAAVNKARIKAASYAKLLGRKLGAVQYLSEQAAPITPIYAVGDVAKGSPTVIDAGLQSISVTVEVRWSLR